MRLPIRPHLGKSLLTIGVCLMAMVILFSVFGRARENARKSSCQSNQKQMGLGFLQYVRDYDGRWPLISGDDHAPPFGAYGWANALQPYTKSINIHNCPSDLWPQMDYGESHGGLYVDYSMNARLSGAKANNMRSANIILVGDGIGDVRGNARYALSSPPDQTEVCGGLNGECQSAWKHLGGANFAFLDGHIKWLRPAEVSATKGDQFTFAA